MAKIDDKCKDENIWRQILPRRVLQRTQFINELEKFS